MFFKKSFLFIVLILSVVFITAVSFVSNSNQVDMQTTFSVSDNSCVLSVKKSYGSPATYVRVSTSVSGGISCIGGREFKTDGEGLVTLKWVSGCYLRKIYVDGTAYEVDFTDGNRYELTMK